ncbi:MAG: helix-turn-helix domain-containing protein [Clostridia bacterium]|nr:helix-turn-helix domain-containing protein [Clostridia bacterium]
MSFIEIEYRERTSSWGMSELQSHDYYELYFLLEGERSFFLGDKMYNITAPAFCVIPPFAMHKTSGGKYKRINVNVTPDNLSPREADLLSTLSSTVAFTLDGEWASTVINLLEKASDLSVMESQERSRLSLSFLHTILYLISERKLVPIDYDAKTAVAVADTLILEIASYINNFFYEELTLSSISEHFYISKNSLCARFRCAMNCSVMQYLGFVRLSHAKELLATTDKSIEEISELCGYSSANYFSLIFKKSIGMSPINYKKTK